MPEIISVGFLFAGIGWLYYKYIAYIKENRIIMNSIETRESEEIPPNYEEAQENQPPSYD